VLLKTELIPDSSEESIQHSKKAIYDALADGKCFFANDYHADSKGFRFFAEVDDKIYQMGDCIYRTDNVKLRVLLPVKEAEIKLIRNGEEIADTFGNSAGFFIEKEGVYRVEVYIHKKSWIYSNHIRIGV
jgi:hypothetical protein